MNATTVTFDVGGSIYKVSRSLLEQHPDTMLARLASDTWSPGGGASPENGDDGRLGEKEKDSDKTNESEHNCEKPLFIERDGARFRYCLDYMRDGGNVVLPPTIPKDALLQDLAYYGFQDLDPSTITVVGSLPMFKTCFDHIDSHLETLRSEISDLERKRACSKLAEHCLSHYKATASLSKIIVEYSEKDSSKQELRNTAWHLKNNDQSYKQVFSETLERFGLKLIKCENYNLSLEYL